MVKLMWTFLSILNVALYLCCIGMWIALPNYVSLNLATTIFTLCMSVLLMYKHRERFRHFVSSSRFEHLTNYGIRCSLILGILGLCNYMAYKHPKQWDFTKERANSLSDESIKVAKSLEGKLKFKVFAGKTERMTIVPLLDIYRYYNSNISLEVIDPALRPQVTNQYNVKKQGTVVVEYGDRRTSFSEHTERAITTSILKVKRTKKPTIAFSTGHEEMEIRGEDKNGVSQLAKYLKQSAYKLQEVHLARTPSLEGIDAFVILGPKLPFLDQELEVLEKFIQAGGRLFVAVNPDFNTTTARKLVQTLKKWGIKIRNDIVVDTQSNVNGSQGLVPIISKFDKLHPITKNFKGTTFFPLTSSVEISTEMQQKFKLKYLLRTSGFPASWAEKNLEQVAQGNVVFTEEKDEKGPVPIAASLEHPGEAGQKGRMVVIGNSTFLANSYAAHGNNFNFFLNALSWLIDEDYKISFDYVGLNKDPVFMSSTQVAVIFYFSVLLAPLLLFGTAIYLYKRKQAM